MAKGFSGNSFDPVSINCSFSPFLGNGQTQAGESCVIPLYQNGPVLVGVTFVLFEDLTVVRACQQSCSARKGLIDTIAGGCQIGLPPDIC